MSLMKALRYGAADPAVMPLDPLVAEARRIADAACNAGSVARSLESASDREGCPILPRGGPPACVPEPLWAGARPFTMPRVSPADRAEWSAVAGEADQG